MLSDQRRSDSGSLFRIDAGAWSLPGAAPASGGWSRRARLQRREQELADAVADESRQRSALERLKGDRDKAAAAAAAEDGRCATAARAVAVADNARINADLANVLSQERDCQTRLTILERRKNELLALKQSHAAAKSFKEASECVNELNAKILPELEQLNTLLVQKKRTVESLQLQFSESETKVGLCREKFREAEKVCAQSRKVRLQTELNTKNSSEDESEVEALKCALELLVLKHPEV